MSNTAAYEVRCHDCQTSFAPETRRCVHCGGPLGRGRILSSISMELGAQPELQPGGLQSDARLGGSQPGAPAEDEGEDIQLATKARNRMWVVMAVMAVIASVARTCGG